VLKWTPAGICILRQGQSFKLYPEQDLESTLRSVQESQKFPSVMMLVVVKQNGID